MGITMIAAVIGLFLVWASRPGMAAYTDKAITLAGVKGAFRDGVMAAETNYRKLTTRIPATTQIENFAWLGAIPQMWEMTDGRKAQGIRTETYQIANKEYESSVEVDQKIWEDDQIGALSLQINSMGAFAESHKDYLLGLLLANGDQAGFVAYDGTVFFNNARVIGDSGAQSNKLSIDVVDASAPTVAEFRSSLAAAIAAMISFKNDKGQPYRTAPTGLVVVVPPSMLFTALEAINATVVSSTTNTLQGVASVIALPDLTEPTEYFLLKTNQPVGPFVFHDRIPLQFEFLGPESEYATTKGKLLATVRGRYTITYAHWHLAVKVEFADAG